MTSEHDSAVAAATSLRANGEVCGGRPPHPPRANTDARGEPAAVVGGSRSGRGGACECRRPAGAGRTVVRPAGVRAAVVARKRGNARRAKGGRKVEVTRRVGSETIRYRLPVRARKPEAESPRPHAGRLLACTTERQMPEDALIHPASRCMSSQRGKLPTGEPCAGDPHARFGGRGGASQCAVPTSIRLPGLGARIGNPPLWTGATAGGCGSTLTQQHSCCIGDH